MPFDHRWAFFWQNDHDDRRGPTMFWPWPHGASVVSTPGFAMLPNFFLQPVVTWKEGFQILAATCMLRVPHIIYLIHINANDHIHCCLNVCCHFKNTWGVEPTNLLSNVCDVYAYKYICIHIHKDNTSDHINMLCYIKLDAHICYMIFMYNIYKIWYMICI